MDTPALFSRLASAQLGGWLRRRPDRPAPPGGGTRPRWHAMCGGLLWVVSFTLLGGVDESRDVGASDELPTLEEVARNQSAVVGQAEDGGSHLVVRPVAASASAIDMDEIARSAQDLVQSSRSCVAKRGTPLARLRPGEV